jgi:predicted dehydrogenase
MNSLNVAMIGTGFMAKAHSVAYNSYKKYFVNPAADLNLKVIVDIDEENAKNSAKRFGFEEWATIWEDVVKRKDIDLVSILTPNYLHAPMAIAAAKEGKHILCEKPLALNSSEAKEVYLEAKKSGIVNMVAFNYRKTPAVEYAKQLIENGNIGDIYAFRGYYLGDCFMDPMVPISWRFKADKAGSGAVGDIGSHLIDFARYLIGDIKKVVSMVKTWVNERPEFPESLTDSFDNVLTGKIPKKYSKVDVDDEFFALVEFENGCLGSLQASRFAGGHKNDIGFEINGSKGSIIFNYSRMNELLLFKNEGDPAQQGITKIITGPNHPPKDQALWPIAGFNIGFNEIKIIEIHDFITAIVNKKQALPNFYDGWKICQVCDAILISSKENRWVEIE